MPSLKTRLAYLTSEPTAQVAGTTVQNIEAGASPADVSGGAVVDVEARDALNDLLAELRGNGIITL
jgi:hypothetical protein